MRLRLYETSLPDRDAEHTKLPRSTEVFDRLADRVAAPTSSASEQPVLPNSIVPISSTGFVLAPGDSATYSVYLSESTQTHFTAFHGPGELRIAAKSPLGAVYDSTSTVNNPLATYHSFPIFDRNVRSVTLASTEVSTGIWAVQLYSDASNSDTLFALATAWIEDPTLTLNPSVSDTTIALGSDLVVYAQIDSSGAPILNAQAQVNLLSPTGPDRFVILLDDGLGQDSQAQDGRYTGVVDSLFVPGRYSLVISALRAGEQGIPSFARATHADLFVSTSTSYVANVVGDEGVDSNANGTFDLLRVVVRVVANNSATYRVFAVLTDNAGKSFTTGVTMPLSTGTHDVALEIDGKLLFEQSVGGPYTVTLLTLSQIDTLGARVVHRIPNAHTTSAYARDSFEHDFVRFLSGGISYLVDSDANGLAEQLRVKLPVGVAFIDDTYEWSATLVDPAGAMLATAASKGLLFSANDSVRFDFPGECIGRSGTSGLCLVKYARLFRPSTGHVGVREQAFETIPIFANAFEGSDPDFQPVTVDTASLTVCPLGDAQSLNIKVVLNVVCGLDASDSSVTTFAVKRPDSSPGIFVWDARTPSNANGDTLRPSLYDPTERAAVMEARAISGYGTLRFDVYSAGLLLAEDVQVQVRSFDFDPNVIGAVDNWDSTAFMRQFLGIDPPGCGDFDWDGDVDTQDRLVHFANHFPHKMHHITRKLSVPNGGETWYPGEVNGIHWVPGQGVNSRVSLYWYRDSAPTPQLIVGNTADDGHHTWGLPTGLAPGTDYRIKLVHTWPSWAPWYYDLGRDVSDTPFEVGDPGCPYVETWTGSGWEPENSILSRSLDAVLSQDAYLLKSEPDATEGKLRLRIYENAQEFTTLDQVAVAALDVSEGAKVLRVGSRYVAGTWEPASRVAKVGGEDITTFTDGSRSEYYVGSPGDTLLVQLPPLKPVGGEGEGSKFGTAQGGGGSGGSGGGKGIDPAPEGPPDFTTAGVSLDDRYLDETGILVQIPDGSGGWQTVQHWYPREHFDDFVVDDVVTGTMRLIFLGRHKLRYLGRFNYEQDGVTPKPARLLSATHSRLGNELADLGSADAKATVIAPGDTVSFEFEAVPPEAGKTRYWFLVANGVYSSTAPRGYEEAQPEPSAPTYQFALGAARPNPTSGDVSIDYALARESNVSLRIYNVAGRLVRDLLGERQKAGPHDLVWNLRDDGGVRVPSGVYFYRLIADEWTSQKKVVFIDR